MRNIKKTWAIMLVVAMMVTSILPTFADEAAFKYSDEATTLNALGLYQGIDTTKFDPDLASTLDRQTGVVMLLRLFGTEAEAAKMTDEEANMVLEDMFTDAADVAPWARKHVAYGVKMGFVKGVGNMLFMPKAPLNAKAYSTLILTQLGVTFDYQTAPADLYAAGGLSSSESIRYSGTAGDSPIIKDDLVGISFGSLRAKDEDGILVIAKLVNSGFVDKAKAIEETVVTEEELNVVVPPSGAAKAMTEVKITGDKTMVAMFDGVVPAEATFEVTGPMTLSPTIAWNEARTEATITNNATFLDGSYTIKVVGAGVEEGKDTDTVIATANGIAKIEIVGDKLIRTSGDAEFGKGFFYVKLTDTYGNDVTKSRAYDVTISFSKDVASELSIDADTGKVEVELDDVDSDTVVDEEDRWDNYPAVPEMVTVTLYSNTVTGGMIASASKTLTVSEQSRVKDITLGAVTFPGSASQILTEKDPAAYIELEALDQFGYEVTDETKLTDDGANTEIVYSISDSDLTVTPEEYTDSNGMDKVRLVVATTDMTDSKKVTMSAISKYKGVVSNQLTLDVRVPKSVEKVTLGAPEKIMAVGDTYDDVLIMPITATDVDGNTLSADDVVSAFNAGNITAEISGQSTITVEIETSGPNKGKLVSTLQKTGETGTLDVSQATLVVELPESNTSRTVTKLLSIRDRAYPVAVEIDDAPASRLLANADTTFNYKFVDQYGRDMDEDMLDYEVTAGGAAADHPTAVKLTATFPTGSDATFTLKTNTDVDGAGTVDTDTGLTLNTTTTTAIVEASELDVDDAITLTAGAEDGTVRLKAELYKEYEMNSIVNSITTSFTIIDGLPSDLTYTIEDVPTLYAYSDSADMDATAGAGTTLPGGVTSAEFQALTTTEAAHVREVKLVAKDASGNTYAVPLANILSSSSSDTNIAHVLKVVGTGSAIDAHDDAIVVYGTDTAFDAENLPATATKTATITLSVSTDDGAKDVTKVVTVSNDEPKSVQVKITDDDQLTTDPYSVEGDEITDLAGNEAALEAEEIHVLSLDQFGVYTDVGDSNLDGSVTGADAAVTLTIVNTNRYANTTTLALTNKNINIDTTKIVADEKVFLMYTAASGAKGQFSITSSQGTAALDATRPTITAIALGNGGVANTIDANDTVTITFSEAIEPTTINAGLVAGASVAGIGAAATANITGVAGTALMTVEDIATFDVGASLAVAGTSTVTAALSANGKVLTLTMTAAAGGVITTPANTAGTVDTTTLEDLAGNLLTGTATPVPTGTF